MNRYRIKLYFSYNIERKILVSDLTVFLQISSNDQLIAKSFRGKQF